MAFYTGAVIREPAMENPTVVVLTDCNDLDDQLFGTFSRCLEDPSLTPVLKTLIERECPAAQVARNGLRGRFQRVRHFGLRAMV